MAEPDDDAPPTAFRDHEDEENDYSEEVQDYRFLSALTGSSFPTLPKRGEKDFEPHGTKQQVNILEDSRQALYDALSYTRVHSTNPKSYSRGFYYGEGAEDWMVMEEWRKGLEDDHVVVVETARSTMFKSMGRPNLRQKCPALWLLPEEALYLVERGTLDLWWPTRASFNGMIETDDKGAPKKRNTDDVEEVDEGAPMSVQAAFAMLIGNDSEKGKVSLDRYAVYSNLKRCGYFIARAPDWDPSKPGQPHSSQEDQASKQSVFSWLFDRLFSASEIEHAPHGPLVKPGMYRSYNSIYRQIAVIPRHKPSAAPEAPSAPSPPDDPYRVIFHLYKPSSHFRKTNPGDPDFRVAVANARTTFIPSLAQVTSLLESTPWDPPKPNMNHSNARLKHGWRNVILAVIDEGITSYIKLGDTAFGEEPLFKRFDRGPNSGSKGGRGGARGRGGRGRGGRGRGRGRGG